MGKIVSNFFMSLDGVVEAPDTWHGARLFEDTTSHGLELIGQQTFGTGVLNLAYAPKG
jgi:hypothetical protein